MCRPLGSKALTRALVLKFSKVLAPLLPILTHMKLQTEGRSISWKRLAAPGTWDTKMLKVSFKGTCLLVCRAFGAALFFFVWGRGEGGWQAGVHRGWRALGRSCFPPLWMVERLRFGKPFIGSYRQNHDGIDKCLLSLPAKAHASGKSHATSN